MIIHAQVYILCAWNIMYTTDLFPGVYFLYAHTWFQDNLFEMNYIMPIFVNVIIVHRMPSKGSMCWGNKAIKPSKRTIWKWPSFFTAPPWVPYRRIYATRQCQTPLIRSWMKLVSAPATCHLCTWRRRTTKKRCSQLRSVVRCSQTMPRCELL